MFQTHELANDHITLLLGVPSEKNGFYRSTRYDWSSMMLNIKTPSHTFTEHPFPPHDPTSTQCGIGTAEEFREFSNEMPCSYERARPGEGFIKIGVGVLVKKLEEAYMFGGNYQIIDYGRWSVRLSEESAEYTHQLKYNDYCYEYNKIISLADGNAGFSIAHTLSNAGENHIDTKHYCHNFFCIDDMPVGRGYLLSFNFTPKFDDDTASPDGVPPHVYSKISGNDIILNRDIAVGHAFGGYIKGFDDNARHNAFALKNINAGAAIRYAGDAAASSFYLWANDRALCVEPYIDISLKKGESKTWISKYVIET